MFVTFLATQGENENVKYIKLKELRAILKTQIYPKMVVEEGIGKALAVPQEQLRSEKSTYIISTYNPNNSNVIPKVREIYGKLQTSKILSKIFAKYKLIDYKRKPSKLNRFLCSSNFPTNKSTFKTTKCGKSWFC